MSTRSVIAMKTENGYIGVYCHFDGYISGVGKILFENYFDETKLKKLIAEGSISSLGKRIGTKHSFDERPKNETTFYHRDRGEKIQILTWKTPEQIIRNMCDCEFFYIWNNGEWLVSEGGEFSKLKDLL